ncbi:MAG TPA: hypothetical protein ACHBX0_09105 [Arsenophonus sp.]
MDEQSKATIEQKLSTDILRGFKATYLDTAMEIKRKQGKSDENAEIVEQLEFDLVLFTSSIIDYDYIMELIAKSTQKTDKQKMTCQQLIYMISANANLMEERDDIKVYINSLKAGEVLNKEEIRTDNQALKAPKAVQTLTDIAQKHGLQILALQQFVDSILARMIFDGEHLIDLLAPL